MPCLRATARIRPLLMTRSPLGTPSAFFQAELGSARSSERGSADSTPVSQAATPGRGASCGSNAVTSRSSRDAMTHLYFGGSAAARKPPATSSFASSAYPALSGWLASPYCSLGSGAGATYAILRSRSQASMPCFSSEYLTRLASVRRCSLKGPTTTRTVLPRFCRMSTDLRNELHWTEPSRPTQGIFCFVIPRALQEIGSLRSSSLGGGSLQVTILSGFS